MGRLLVSRLWTHNSVGQGSENCKCPRPWLGNGECGREGRKQCEGLVQSFKELWRTPGSPGGVLGARGALLRRVQEYKESTELQGEYRITRRVQDYKESAGEYRITKSMARRVQDYKDLRAKGLGRPGQP